MGWISGTDAIKTSSNINEIGAVEVAPPRFTEYENFSVRGVRRAQRPLVYIWNPLISRELLEQES